MIKKLILIFINILVIFFFLMIIWQNFKVIESFTKVVERKFYLFLIPLLLFVFNYYFDKKVMKNQRLVLSKILLISDLIIILLFIGYPLFSEISK